MLRLLTVFSFLSLLVFSACKSPQPTLVKLGGGLELQRLSSNLYIHTTPLETSTGQVFPCNGMIFIDGGEAIVFDTPVDDAGAEQLINWLQTEQKVTIKAVIPTHFHIDCLGGLAAFHKAGIKSYANAATQALAVADGKVIPQETFEGKLSLTIGQKSIECWHPGEAHTKDNVVAWVPSKKALFGGCMLKSMGAGKGNLADANVNTWSASLLAVKEKYPKLKFAVPGHGASGGVELLDFTIQLFGPK